jgi:molecular chaperone DnaK (HSP70)
MTAASHPSPIAASGQSPIVGIDLGTTNSLIAVAHLPSPGDPPRCLPVEGASPMLPSVVRLSPSGALEAVGQAPRQQAANFPERTIASVKRLMGRSTRDLGPGAGKLSYRVVDGPSGSARVELAPGVLVSPQEVSSHILRALRSRAESAVGRPITRAVITVPAYFDDAQRQATRDAAVLAGLEPVRVINEPTAAALAYGLGLRHAAGTERRPMNIVVYDLGGGTFDLSILRITPAAPQAAQPVPVGEMAQPATSPAAADFFQVLATAGDTQLGGDDFDDAIMTWAIGHLPESERALPAADRQRLRERAEAAKIALSSVDSAELPLPTGQVLALSRATFETLVQPLVDRTLEACRRAMRDARRALALDASGRPPGAGPIDAIVLVGGSTRVPLVRQAVEKHFGLIPYTAIDPDQVVALGAAIQGAVLAGGSRDALLIDVVPLSLGLETVGGAMAKLIVRNSAVPARASEMFSTGVDNQTGIKLHVLQGEREMAADCRSLARLEITGVPPMPAGIPRLRVEFAVDASGILSISAVEERSGKRLSAQVVPNHGLTQAEVDRLDRESLAFAREDMQRHRIADLISHSRIDTAMIERQLSRHAGALHGDELTPLQAHLGAVKAFIASASADWSSVDPDAFQHAKEALDRASMRLHEIAITASLKA